MGNWLFTDKELVERERVRLAGPEELPYTKTWFQQNRRSVFCYGAGGTLFFALHALAGVEVAGVVDGNSALWGKSILGYEIEPPKAILKDRENAVVVISVNTSSAMKAIAAWCGENGICCVGWDDVVSLSAGAKWKADLEAIPEAEAAANIWADDLSRDTYAVLMKIYASFSPAIYPAYVPNHYFQEFVPRKYYRDFVDLGAFRGDTLAAFREWMNDDFDSYYAVEAMPDNFAALRDSVSDKRVRLFNTAIGGTTGTTRMRYEPSSMYAAAMGDEGSLEVPLRTLDDLLDGCPVGMVKMDIEGAEPEALRGTEKTIHRCNPALAISVYHQAEHLWSIPLWIKKVCPSHSLFLRHHSDLVGETVCYAVPE